MPGYLERATEARAPHLDIADMREIYAVALFTLKLTFPARKLPDA